MSQASPDIARTRTLAAQVLANIRRIIHAIHAQSAVIEQSSGLTGPQFWALREIDGSLGGLSLGELAKRLVLHKATAGRIVERLQTAGLVRCERPENDRRFVLVRITSEGARIASRPLPGPAQAGLLTELEKLPIARVEVIDGALAQVVAMLGAERMEAGPLFDDKLSSRGGPRKKAAKRQARSRRNQ